MFENQSPSNQPILFNQTSTSNTLTVTVIPHKLPIPLHDDPLYNTFLQPSQIDLIQKSKLDGYLFGTNAQPTLFLNNTKIKPSTLPYTEQTQNLDPIFDEIQFNTDDLFTLKLKPSKHYYINLERHNLTQYENLINYPTHNPLSYDALFLPCDLHSPLIHSITNTILKTHPDLLTETPQKKWSFSVQNPTEKNLKQVINFLKP